MRFKNFLNEQLIAVPEELKNTILDYVFQSYLQYVRENLDSSNDKFEPLENLLIRTYQIKESFKIKLDNSEIKFLIKPEDIPQEYRDVWKYKKDHIKLVIDWEQKKWPDRPLVGGVFKKNSGKIIINPRLLMDTVKNGSYDFNDYYDAFDKPKFTIWHELTHLMQLKAIIYIDPTQVAKETTGLETQIERMTPEYREKYLQNQLEFDPQIKTSIYRFLKLFRRKIKNKNDFKECFNLYTLKGDYGHGNDFFRVLFAKQPEKWKIAVDELYDFLINNYYSEYK